MATSAKEWKGKLQKDLPLPSGNTCLVKRVSLDTLLRTGKVPNSLMDIMKGAIAGRGPTVDTLKEATPEQVMDMIAMMDVVVVACVIEPKVYEVPTDDEQRDDEKLYIDEVDEQDKHFIFAWALGGPSDFKKFLDGQAEVVGALQASNGSEPASEHAAVSGG